jgi:catechol 2,3-dioxygenase-like lactoylglutathione lyase family enzyme
MSEEAFWNPMVPELSVSNINRSLDFYCGLLGFSIRFAREEEGFAYLELGRVQLMLEQLAQDRWQTGELGYPFGRGINFQMEVDDITPGHDRLQKAGIGLFRPLTEIWRRAGDHEDGQKEYLVQDPDGYLLRFVEILGSRPLGDAHES